MSNMAIDFLGFQCGMGVWFCDLLKRIICYAIPSRQFLKCEVRKSWKPIDRHEEKNYPREDVNGNLNCVRPIV